MGGNKKRGSDEVAAAPPVKTGASTLFVLFLFVLVSVGCGVGYQYLLEQTKMSNDALVASISSLQEELKSVKESYASINFENEIAVIGQMKEDLQETRLQSNELEKKIEGFQTAISQLTEASNQQSSDVANKITQAQAAVDANMKSISERISSVESGLASQLTAATKQSVEAKQAVEQLKTTVASNSEKSTKALTDGLEHLKQNLAAVIDTKKQDEEKLAKVANDVAAVVQGSVSKTDLAELSKQITDLKNELGAVQKDTGDYGKLLQESTRSFEAKVNRLNANMKMTTSEVAGIREMVTTMVATQEPATEAPLTEE